MPALVIDGHPNADSLTAALAQRYADEYGNATRVALRDLDFDPVLRQGYRGQQTLEPDLAATLDAMLSATHITIATPIWWASTPALLKGFFDRILLPKVTYQYRANGLPEGLLRGRSGRVIITSDSPRWLLALIGDPASVQVRKQTLGFCGIRPTSVSRFTDVRHASPARRESWLDRIARDARRDAQRAEHTPSPSGRRPVALVTHEQQGPHPA
ncbi:NAD(P)H-dependent oxidoreductase [Microbacterium amylolyticum]|uniref:NADPH-quinone reductase n=1 Tax=Microbacterium amylolyticum TaxID=936337 RepID=A0ABS4ZG10_9MICO|nr:NAD(P)H-dependent oxidoreductase [Microbacterium amylolyticum]MBP2436207.1 putative NADPH-quinone reductase [Microbacterium amylolyticum]